MATVAAYHRPNTLEEALGLLSTPGRVALAGGTVVNATRTATPVDVVDLQALGLGGIGAVAPGRLRLGATASLQDLVDDPRVPPLLQELARREAPSALRTLATVGGTVVVADPDSELLAGLLVHDARVMLAGPTGERTLPLAVVLADPAVLAGALVVAVDVETGGTAAAVRTARTPADRPIVAAVARRAEGGSLLLALTGVAPTPVLVDPDRLADLSPPGDFRGSSAYRAHLAATLAARVHEEVA